MKIRKKGRMLVSESAIHRAIQLLTENIAEEAKAVLVSKLDGDEAEAARMMDDFGKATKEFSSKAGKEHDSKELREKMNIGYWKKRFSNADDSGAVEDFRNFAQYLGSLSKLSLTKAVDQYAADTTLKFNLTNPRGLPFSVIFKFTHQAAVRTSEKMGGSALCTASSGTCSHFRDYSSTGPLVTLTAISGESPEERKEQHRHENPEDVKSSSYNVQTNLITQGAFDPKTGEFDPSKARFGSVMWYDDAKFYIPKDNIPKLYGIDAAGIAELLLKGGEKSKKFLDHIRALGGPTADSYEAQENMEKSLGIKNPGKEWLSNWMQVVFHDGGNIKHFPSLKATGLLSNRDRFVLSRYLNIAARYDEIKSRKFYSGVKFEQGIIEAMPGYDINMIWACNFDSCTFVGSKDQKPAHFLDCNVSGGVFTSGFRAAFKPRLSQPYTIRGVNFEQGSKVLMSGATMQSCRFEGLIMSNTVKFFGGRVIGSRFVRCDFEDYTLSELANVLEVEDTSFAGCNIKYTDMGGIVLRNVEFGGCDFRRSDLKQARMSGVRFVDCDLREADLSGADLSGAEFVNCKLDGVLVDEEFAGKVGRGVQNEALKKSKGNKERKTGRKIKITERQLRRLVGVITESPQMTIGQLRQALSHVKEKGIEQAKKDAAKSVGGMAADFAKDMVGIGAIANLAKGAKDIADIYRNAGKIVTTQEKEKNPFWDVITLDPGKEKVIDDRVEQEFIQALADRVGNLPDNAPVPNADIMLNRFLKDKFGGTFMGPTEG